MEQSQLSKIIKILTMSYPYYFKDMNEEDIMTFTMLYKQKLKDYGYIIVAKAIDNLITTNDFMPSLAEVIKECDKQKRIYYKKTIDEMYKNGYFKTDEEYGKSLTWLFEDKPLIPNWLQSDVNKFLLENKSQIEMKGE